MNCPNGHKTETRDTRVTANNVMRRRRHCPTCGVRITTYEVAAEGITRPGDTFGAVLTTRQAITLRKLLRDMATLFADIGKDAP